MTTWGQLRDLAVSRMAEYMAGAAEQPTGASFSDVTIYARMTISYRRMIDAINKRDPKKTTILSATFPYAASTELLALPAALQTRPIFDIERLLTSSTPATWEPLEELEEYQDERARQLAGEYPLTTASYTGLRSSYGYKLEGMTNIYILPTPTEDLTLRARYNAVQADLVAPIPGGSSGDRDNTPAFIPAEHLPVVALDVALSFLRETGGNATLDSELQTMLWPDFIKWAASSPKRGPRFVLET